MGLGSAALLLSACGSRPDPVPTHEARMLCMSIADPETFRLGIERQIGTEYHPVLITLPDGTTRDVRNYAPEQLTINEDIVAGMYQHAQQTTLENVVNPALVIKPDGVNYRSAPLDGAIMIVHDGEPSQYLSCVNGALAVTTPAGETNQDVPPVSEVSLRRVRQYANGSPDPTPLAYAFGTEIWQQKYNSNLDTRHQEQMANGWGFLSAYLTANRHIVGSTPSYADYVSNASNTNTTHADDITEILPIAIYDEQTYNTMATIISSSPFTWTDPQE